MMAIDDSTLLVNHHKRYIVHHSAPRREKGRQPRKSMMDDDGRDSNQYYGEDIRLSKEKYAVDSAQNKDEADKYLQQVDDYY